GRLGHSCAPTPSAAMTARTTNAAKVRHPSMKARGIERSRCPRAASPMVTGLSPPGQRIPLGWQEAVSPTRTCASSRGRFCPARSHGAAFVMPFSTYLPEHMGSITLAPRGPFVAGSHAELTLVYTAGTFGIDDTGMVKISWRTTSDMSKPQFDKPQAANFTTVEASNGARLEVWVDRLNVRPFANTLLIRVGRGYLREGDTLTVRLGDRRQGSPGFRLQTNVEANVELKTSVDAFATYEFCELPVQPSFDLVPGPVASWKAILPSLAFVGEPFRLAIVAEDKWGNPTADASQSFELVASQPLRGLPAQLQTQTPDTPR